MKNKHQKFNIIQPQYFIPKEAEYPEFWIKNNRNYFYKQDWDLASDSDDVVSPQQEQNDSEDYQQYEFNYQAPWFVPQISKGKVFTGYKKQDLDAFTTMYDSVGDEHFREFLTKIAGLESKWQNNPKGNKTHSGLYQIKNSYIEHYTGIPGISVEDFVKDPRLQTRAAINLAKENYNQIIKDEPLLKAAKQRGYDEWDLMAGAWLAGYSGMRRQFFTGKEIGDANGTTITKRMNAYKNMII